MSVRTPLVLLPGLLLDGDLWTAQVAALSDVADPVVVTLSACDSMEAMAEAVLAAVPGPFALAGLSMGGYAAFAVMRRAPERVTRLALLDTSPRPDTPERRAERVKLIAQARVGQFKGISPRLLPNWIHPARMDDAALTGRVYAMAERIGRDGFIREVTAIMDRPDSRPLLPQIGCPTLVLCGRQDQSTPVELHLEMAAGIARARLIVIEECGHLSPMEKPDEVSRAMRAWLTDEDD